MIDTIRSCIRVKSELIPLIEAKLNNHQVFSNETGEILSQYTRLNLQGSWDSNISIMIRDQKWVIRKIDNKTKCIGKFKFKSYREIPLLEECDPYLLIEFSLPKVTIGVNFVNTTLCQDILMLQSFRRQLQKSFGVELPYIGVWELERIDVGNNYFLGSNSNVLYYFEILKMIEYPRRKRKAHHYQTGIFFPGSTTVFKMYSKWHDFKVHDFKRFANRDTEKAKMVHALTEGILRHEVSIKKRQLKNLGIITFDDFISKLEIDVFLNKEMVKIMNTAEMSRVMKRDKVVEIIMQMKKVKGKHATGEVLLAVWDSIVLKGKEYARKQHGKNKFYRAMAFFKKNDIPLTGDLQEREKKVAQIFELSSYRKVSPGMLENYLQIVNL